ncbi:unnamed protein product [Durusdinium trenchii]|uniref:PROP1-like PPR domain-containing protein n=1 Tax=Durusdinium trenchii TaxID=1381693 RepID=A0ABP0RG56_9DINO
MVLHPDRGRRGRAPGVLVRAVLLGAALLSFEPLRGLWSFVSSPRPSRQHARTAAHAGARSDKRPSPIPEQVSAILQRYAKTLKVSEVKSSFQKILDSGTTLAVGQYNRALEAMAKAKRPGDAAEFLTFMEAQVQPEGAAYDHLVTSHLNAGDFEEALKTLLSSPTVLLKTCKRLLRSLLEQKKDVKSATRLMSCMPAMGLQPSYPMYKGMVAAAAEEGNLDLADRWFQQLKENGMQPESGLFVSLIKGCWKARDPERAVRYFNLMRRLPGEEATFPRGTYSWLIRSLAQDRDAESAANLLERMRAAGLDPSLETYEAVLKAWSELQLPDMRKKLEQSWIQGLKANGTKVSRDVYKTLMRASKSDIRSMEEWMNQMQMAGHWVGVYEYNNLLQACESAIDYRSAEKWFDRMTQANVTANAVSYNLIIKTMAKAGQPKKAKQWGRRMEQAGLLSSKTLQFELVVKSLLQTSQNSADYIAGWAAKANELKKDMNASVYHNVMRAYFLENKPEEARQWVEWMETNGTSTNSETYMMLMRYDDRQTTFWHQKMDEKGVPPSTDSFNLVLRSLSEVKGKKRLPLVEEWYERMQDAGCPPNEETYALLISAAAKSGQNEAGEQWFSKMTKSGLSPDREVYQALMLRSLREGDPVAVRQILDWMVLKGIKLNRGMYNLAIRAFAEAGEAEGAEEIFRRLQAAGRDPDERSFFHLIDCHVRQRAMEKARDWLDQMLEIGVRPSFRIYAALAAGYARTGDVASTKEFLDTIKVKMYTSKITRDTWTAMMEPVLWCLEQAGEEEEVQNWLAFAEQKGFPVNVAEPMEADEDAEMNAPQQRTEGGRPRGAGDADKVKQAMNALDAMKSQGKTPTIEDFNKVMWRFASSSRSQYSQARDFLETSILPVIQPTARTFLELLRCNRRGDGRRGIYTLEWMHDQGFTITRAHVDVVARSKQPGSFLQTRGVRVMSSAEATQEVSSQRSESMPLKDFLATVTWACGELA